MNGKDPTLEYEKKYLLQGFCHIAGIDEAGRGPLAGPVVAVAAILPDDFENFGIRDSKMLSEKKRDELFDRILASKVLYGIGIVNHKKIDQINIFQATQLAMKKAIEKLPCKPDVLLVDGMKLRFTDTPQEKIIKGDQKVLSIAVASVIAKVTRDRIMQKFDLKYPGYGLARHKGYPTKSHCEAINTKGLLPIHRLTYGPVREVYDKMSSEGDSVNGNVYTLRMNRKV